MPGLPASEPDEASKALVDTHVLVWALSDPSSISGAARGLLETAEVVASVASLWELILKRHGVGALLADPLPWWDKYVIRSGIPVLGIRQAHVLALGQLPEYHKDPFDRILVAQAQVERAVLVTKDEALGRYGVPTVW